MLSGGKEDGLSFSLDPDLVNNVSCELRFKNAVLNL